MLCCEKRKHFTLPFYIDCGGFLIPKTCPLTPDFLEQERNTEVRVESEERGVFKRFFHRQTLIE